MVDFSIHIIHYFKCHVNIPWQICSISASFYRFLQNLNIVHLENVKNSTVKPTEKFREEGVGRDPFLKGGLF